MVTTISTPPPAGMHPAAPVAKPEAAPLQAPNGFVSGVDAASAAPDVAPVAGQDRGAKVGDAGAAGGLLDLLPMNGPFEGVNKRLERVISMRREYNDLVRSGGMDPNSTEAQDFRWRMNEELLRLQIEAGQAQFGVELAAKVIEHGTSATKNVMQTQI